MEGKEEALLAQFVFPHAREESIGVWLVYTEEYLDDNKKD